MYKHKNGMLLKKVSESDLKLMKGLKNESWFGTHQITFVNDNDQQKWFESLDDRKQMMLTVWDPDKIDSFDNTLVSNPHPIGLYKINNIDWMNRSYDSAHDVFEYARGRGYGKKLLEAGVDFGFEVLNMQRLDTQVLENNIASLKCALFAGFVEEGIRRKAVHKCNQYLDSIFLGILREDWEQSDRVKKYKGVCNNSYIPKDKK